MSDNTTKNCPRCNLEYTGYSSISKRDNKTEICCDCAISEILQDAGKCISSFDFSFSKKLATA